MPVTAELLKDAPASAHRALARPSRKPRRRAYRRSEFGRPHFVELDARIDSAIEDPAWARAFWERYAIPAGMTVFGLAFVASNWNALRQLLGAG